MPRGTDAAALEEDVLAAASTAERVDRIQQFLLRQLGQHHKDSVEALARRVRATRGRQGVKSLCRELGITERTLERTFARSLGVSPKQFLRLQRFLHTCHLLRHVARPTLAELALRAGYYDQAHCIADFQEFAGMTPRAFVGAEKTAFLDIG